MKHKNASLYNDIENLVDYILEHEGEDFAEQMNLPTDCSEETLDQWALRDRDHIYGCAVRVWHAMKRAREDMGKDLPPLLERLQDE
jgi:hypothetical protein